MFHKIPYVDAERRIIGEHAGFLGRGMVPTYNTPVTPRANFAALFDEKHPYWMPDGKDNIAVHPMIYNMNLGRGHRADLVDVFGVKWKYEPTSGGSITVGGNPLLDDVNNWKQVIKIPDIDAWDWPAAAEETPVDAIFPCYISLVNGFWFERLISFMDFMPAAMALIDDDQTDAVKELFDATTDLACKLVDKICANWPQIDFIEVHDDWGAQKAPFFSRDVADELFVPYMKRFTDRVHAWGRHTMLHSCGHTEERVECYINAGFEFWTPQPMNDIGALYDQYGDRMIFGVWPEETDLAERTEEEQRAAARRFVDRFCQPGKPSVMSVEASRRGTPAFMDEVYIYSRAKYLAEGARPHPPHIPAG